MKSSKQNVIVPGGVDEYIAQFPDSIQAKLSTIRETIRKIAPDSVETVSYFGIPGYSYEGYDYNGMFVWFSYDNKNIRLHLRPPVLDNFEKEVKNYDKTKSIIKFSPDEDIPTQLIEQLVNASLKVMIEK
jgi:uncharacterized protein YdhG (YjbR/CyaY superfamily)